MNHLEGQRVAFTGRLASMTRPEAADLIRAHGGTFVTSVNRRTSLLVVGQEGWPLRKDGGLSEKLETAKHLHAVGAELAILTEAELLVRLGLEGSTNGVHKLFTLAQLGRLLKVTRDRLRTWMRTGLLTPAKTVQGVCYFDFQQVSGVRTLWDLTQAGVKVETIRRSLEQLTRWLPSLDASLAQLQLFERNGLLLLRTGEGRLVEPSGQLHFDFDNRGESPVAESSPATLGAAGCWEKACSLEESGQLQAAANAYREALFRGGPDAKVCFNLGNVLYTLGHAGQAAERFRQAVELDHDFTEAWNNLGNVLIELGQADEALTAYRRAVELDPDYADVRYNLADALEQACCYSEARRHWKAYVRLEPFGEWADYARKSLARRG